MLRHQRSRELIYIFQNSDLSLVSLWGENIITRLGRFDYCNYVIIVVPFGLLAVTNFDTTLQWIVGFPRLEHLG